MKSFFETPIQRSTFTGLRSIVQLKTLAEHKGTGPRWKQVIWTTNGAHCTNWGYSSLPKACFTFLHVGGLGSSFYLKDLTNPSPYLGDRCARCILKPGLCETGTDPTRHNPFRIWMLNCAGQDLRKEKETSLEANCSQEVKKFSVFYRSQMLVTVASRAHHLSLSWARWIWSIQSHCNSLRFILMIFAFTSRFSKRVLSFGFPQ